MDTPRPTIAEPIARVLPLLGVAHLDRLFDYSIPAAMEQQVRPGVRVRIRFAGRLVDALVRERRRTSEHPGVLKPIERVISPDVVCSPQMWDLVDNLATRSAGVRSDILRTALPPRHASAEKSGLFGGGKSWVDLYGSLIPVDELAASSFSDANSALTNHPSGQEFVSSILRGEPSAASILTLPGQDSAYLAAALAAATVWNTSAEIGATQVAEQGSAADLELNGEVIDGEVLNGGVLIVVPNQKDVDRVSQYLRQWVSAAQITEMTAAEGPSARYRRFLSILHGQARLVVGTRSAVFSPVQNLRLVLVLGESDDNLVDPRAPYLHARDVAQLRAQREGAAFATIGVHRCAEVQQWIQTGQLQSIAADRAAVKEHLPIIRALGETDLQREREAYARGSRLPALAFSAIRQALDAGHPVLVQVPRRGYGPALSCAKCRSGARCRHCNGPLELPASGEASVPRCRWCGASAGVFTCNTCGNHTVRMSVVGQDRTVEELGRAFPGVPIVPSGGEQVQRFVEDRASIIVATPGAEPRVTSRPDDEPSQPRLFGAAVMLDPWIVLGKEDLRAAENAVKQWMQAISLVKSHSQGGLAVLTADASLPAVQKVIRWDPERAAQAELSLREEARFPPAVTVAAVDGTTVSIEQLLQACELPESAEKLGPVELPPGVRLPVGLDRATADEARRMIIRVPHEDSLLLGETLKTAQAVRATQKNAGPLRVILNPVRIG